MKFLIRLCTVLTPALLIATSITYFINDDVVHSNAEALQPQGSIITSKLEKEQETLLVNSVTASNVTVNENSLTPIIKVKKNPPPPPPPVIVQQRQNSNSNNNSSTQKSTSNSSSKSNTEKTSASKDNDAKKSSGKTWKDHVGLSGNLDNMQALIDRCSGPVYIRFGSGSVIAEHNHCGGAWMLDVKVGDTVVITGNSAGTYKVTGSKNVAKGTNSSVLNGGLWLQTCYFHDDNLMRLVQLTLQ